MRFFGGPCRQPVPDADEALMREVEKRIGTQNDESARWGAEAIEHGFHLGLRVAADGANVLDGTGAANHASVFVGFDQRTKGFFGYLLLLRRSQLRVGFLGMLRESAAHATDRFIMAEIERLAVSMISLPV